MPGTDQNPITAALATFLESPVMIFVGSCDDGLLPQVARAAGAVVDRATGRIDLIVSGWQWPQTIANVGRNGRLAVTTETFAGLGLDRAVARPGSSTWSRRSCASRSRRFSCRRRARRPAVSS